MSYTRIALLTLAAALTGHTSAQAGWGVGISIGVPYYPRYRHYHAYPAPYYVYPRPYPVYPVVVQPVAVEFVGPDQLPALLGVGRDSGGGQQQGGGDRLQGHAPSKQAAAEIPSVTGAWA